MSRKSRWSLRSMARSISSSRAMSRLVRRLRTAWPRIESIRVISISPPHPAPAAATLPWRGGINAGQHQRAGNEERDQHRHAGLSAGGRGGDDADQQRAGERGNLSRQREQPEELRDAVGGREPRQQRARRGLYRPGDRADQQPDRQIGAFGSRGKKSFSGRRRRDRHEADAVGIDRENRRRRQDQDHEAAEDHPLRAVTVVELAAQKSADRARDGQQDAEGPDLDRAPAERAGRVDAAEREQRDQPVGTDHVGEQKQREIALARQLPDRLRKRAEPGAQRVGNAALPRPVRREGEQRPSEDDQPDRRERSGGAVALVAERIETEQRGNAEQRLAGGGTGGQQTEHRRET